MADRKEVFVVTEGKDGKSYWNRIGAAFVNRDGSLSVHLDALPVSGKMQIRDPRPRDDNQRGDRQRQQPRREPEQTGFEDRHGSQDGDAIDDGLDF